MARAPTCGQPQQDDTAFVPHAGSATWFSTRGVEREPGGLKGATDGLDSWKALCLSQTTQDTNAGNVFCSTGTLRRRSTSKHATNVS